MTNAPFASIDDFRDIEAVNHYHYAVEGGENPERVLAGLRAMGRDNARTPMQWDAKEHAGFTTGTPWIAVNPDHTTVNAAAQSGDPDSVLHHYRRLIALRHTEPAVVHGDFTPLWPQDEHVYAFTRRHAGTELLVLGNFTAAPVPLDLPAGWTEAEQVIGTVEAPDPYLLAPWEARVLRR